MKSRALGAAVALAMAAAVAGSCYDVPPLSGHYRCANVAQCTGDMLCDDGVCCRIDGDPLCLSYVLDGGRCVDGGQARTFFPDNDQDTYGNKFERRFFCAKPAQEHFVEEGGDCDDDNPNTHPGATEVCDGKDNDCNDVADDNPVGAPTYYRDQDRDTYGDPADTVRSCEQPLGFVGRGGDCAPFDAGVNPGAKEVCNGRDEDCDGVNDNGVLVTFFRDQDGDGFGRSDQTQQACTKPSGYAVDAGDCDDAVPTTYPGAPDYCDSVNNDCSGPPDEQPYCGGPVDLLARDGGISRGAQNLNTEIRVWDRCFKNYPGATSGGEVFDYPDDGGTQISWKGAGTNSHIAWAEANNPQRPWDLTPINTSLRIRFSYRITGNAGPWEAIHQPRVFLCGPGGWVSYRPFGATTVFLNGLTGTVDTSVPLRIPAGTNIGNWYTDSTITDAFLRRVQRVELWIEPTTDTPLRNFEFTFTRFGFEP